MGLKWPHLLRGDPLLAGDFKKTAFNARLAAEVMFFFLSLLLSRLVIVSDSRPPQSAMQYAEQKAAISDASDHMIVYL